MDRIKYTKAGGQSFLIDFIRSIYKLIKENIIKLLDNHFYYVFLIYFYFISKYQVTGTMSSPFKFLPVVFFV